MARDGNITAVIEGIVSAFRGSVGRQPTAGEIIAACGVSSATYYRILKTSTEAQATLAAATNAFDAQRTSEVEEDPIARDPHGAVRELQQTIASLVEVIEQQRDLIGRLREQAKNRQQVTRLTDSPTRARP